jgi:N-acetylneuraminate synthase
MHCVAIYPTPAEKLNLNQIDELRTRYPNCVIGFSTHEDPENLQAVGMAVAKGAQMFERHVGLNTEKYSLNAYSSDPQQLEEWMRSFRTAKEICGGNERAPASAKETNSLRSLMRGVYAKTEIKEGQTIHDDDVFFAMPLQEGQLVSGEYHAGLKATKTYRTGELIVEPSESHQPTESEIIEGIVLQTKGLMREARIPLRSATSIDISHHYGLERFREFGCVVVDCINRTYCKKLIVLLPRQKHPYHYHLRKEETFQLLHGDVEVCVDGHQRKLELGETLLVEPEAWHKFHTLDGCIFEEISTTHFNDDSFYDDPQIAKLPREKRKTVVDQDLWMK